MKKKTLSILLISVMVIMTLLLNACGKSSSSDTAPKENTEEKETPSKENTEKEITHEFDVKTNQTETFYELSYQVPASWQRNATDDETKLFYYPQDGMLMLSYSNIPLDFSDDAGCEEYVSVFVQSYENYSELDRYKTTILDNILVFNFTFTCEISDIPITAHNIAFSTDNGTYIMVYANYNTSSYDRFKDFDEIIKSISLNANNSDSKSVDNNTASAPQITTGQLNALSSARDYLNVMAFSHSGLIDQLKFEGYSAEEAAYAADNCGADWNEQAAKKAQEYLNTMSFSRSGLVEQLQFEGFTAEQAEYGVSAVGY